MVGTHQKWRSFQVESLNAHCRFLHDVGVSSPAEYIRWFDSSDPEPYQQQGIVDGLGLHAFYRTGSFNSQSVAIVGTNPRLNTSVSDLKPVKDSENAGVTRRVNEAGQVEDGSDMAVEPLIAEAERSYVDYLAGGAGANFRTMLSILAAQTDLLSLPNEVTSDYFAESFFDDVYFTNWWKMATEDDSRLLNDSTLEDAGLREIATELLERELFDITKPDLVIAYGRGFWNTLVRGGGRAGTPRPLAGGPIGETIRYSHGHLYEYCDTPIIPLKHYSRFTPPDHFKESCRLATS